MSNYPDMLYGDFYDPSATWRQAITQSRFANEAHTAAQQYNISANRRARSRPRSDPRRHFSGGSPPQLSCPALASTPRHVSSKDYQPPPIWPHMNSLAAGLARQYEQGINTDVTIKCVDSRFGFYKIVLAAYSDVFQAMFEHDNCKENQQGVVEVEGCSPEAFKTFLDLLILGRPSKDTILDSTLALEIFVLADKYNVPCLRAHLAPIVAKKVNKENCLRVLVTAYLHDSEDMMGAGLTVLRENKEQLTNGEEWKHMVQDYPKLINTLLMRIL